MAGARLGLPVPRVPDATLQRFLETVAEAIEGGDLATLADVNRAIAQAGTGTGTGTATEGTGLPTLAIPPKPIGLQLACGIGVCIVSWGNPFRIYANHALARVYRHTADEFNNATEIGMAQWLLYVDETPESETEYFYWVRFENTEGVLGPPSDSVSGMTALDPEAVHEEISNWLQGSPLLEVLESPIESPAFVLEEIRRLSGVLGLILASVSDVNANAAIDNRLQITALAETVNALQANPGGFSPGPMPNQFFGIARAAAETARDTQASGDAAWLAAYEGDATKFITLRFD